VGTIKCSPLSQINVCNANNLHIVCSRKVQKFRGRPEFDWEFTDDGRSIVLYCAYEAAYRRPRWRNGRDALDLSAGRARTRRRCRAQNNRASQASLFSFARKADAGRCQFEQTRSRPLAVKWARCGLRHRFFFPPRSSPEPRRPSSKTTNW
jgi:hypothetical protein